MLFAYQNVDEILWSRRGMYMDVDLYNLGILPILHAIYWYQLAILLSNH